MMVVYVRTGLSSAARVVLSTMAGIVLYSTGVWFTKPWLLYKVLNLKVFTLAILPMFLIFSIAFEVYYLKRTEEINDRLGKVKSGKNN